MTPRTRASRRGSLRTSRRRNLHPTRRRMGRVCIASLADLPTTDHRRERARTRSGSWKFAIAMFWLEKRRELAPSRRRDRRTVSNSLIFGPIGPTWPKGYLWMMFSFVRAYFPFTDSQSLSALGFDQPCVNPTETLEAIHFAGGVVEECKPQ